MREHLVQMIDFNVQIPCFNHGFPEEEQEEKHHEKNERPFHHAREVKAERKNWIGAEKNTCAHTMPFHITKREMA